MRRRILITGGAGFIASNFIHFWNVKYPNDKLIILDNLTYAGNLSNIKNLIDNSKINFEKGDISNEKIVEFIINKFSINHIINFAAESHVDRSISGPNKFIRTNILGTFTLLDKFKKYWIDNGSDINWRFIQISSDEVFGSLGLKENSFEETTAYAPRSPYSASKAASDHLAMAWFHTYGLPIIVSNCSNNYGPYQFPEKLIPKTIISYILNKKIPVYGNGSNIRDWLYVDDHITGLDKIITKGSPGLKYCIGGDHEINNLKLVELICDIGDDLLSKNYHSRSKDLIEFVNDRPGHDFRYSINSSLMQRELKWKQKIDLKSGLIKTFKWYLDNKKWWQKLIEN